MSDGQTVTINDVYDDAAKPVIEDIMQGYNGTIFVYGQTSSGKTHTMQGPSIDDPQLKGVIPRMINTVFDCISKADENIEFIVKASYIEIYMERIRDLLDPRKDNLKVREEKGKGVWVEGTTEVYIYREDDILEVMRAGSANRAIAETKMNAESSRSHSIFILSIQQKNLKEGSMKSGKLYLVDLAGSEKISKTGAQGLTLDEAKMINKSLSSLGNVINALTDGKSAHIPYRDSKLTRVLQESLGGNSRTTLIINCSPSSYNEVETVSTLRFGSRAKNIKNKAKINQERSAAELKVLLLKAEKEIETLKGYVKELESVSGVVHPKKLLFKKEEELKELSEQLDQYTIQIHDKEQELEGMMAVRQESENLAALNQAAQQENSKLSSQLSEMKLSLDRTKYELVEMSLTMEGLQAENASIKTELTSRPHQLATGGGEYSTSPSVRSMEDPSLSITKHNDEWAEKEEQLKLLQRTPSKAKSKSLGSTTSSNASPLSLQGGGGMADESLVNENEALRKRIEELESLVASQANNSATDMSSDTSTLDTSTISDMTTSTEITITDMTSSLQSSMDGEMPSEMILQAEQLRKLLNENADQRGLVDALRTENKRLTARLTSVEEEKRQKMEEELNVLREQTNQKLMEFGSLKESLLRDLENRCQKVIDLELALDEFQDRNATLTERLKRTTKMNGDQESSMLQLKLDDMTSVKHQLSMEVSKLQREATRATKQLELRNEHIYNLENTITESEAEKRKIVLKMQTLETELSKFKSDTLLDKKHITTAEGARIVRPLRGGASTKVSLSAPTNIVNTSKNARDAPSPLSLSAQSNNTPTSASGATSPSHPGKLNSENSTNSLWNIFRKKQSSPSQTPKDSSHVSGNTSPLPPAVSPIPMSLNAYAPAVPSSSVGASPVGASPASGASPITSPPLSSPQLSGSPPSTTTTN
eukprot:gene19800-23715_t